MWRHIIWNVQDDQLNMVVFYITLKSALYATVHMNTGQVAFYKVPEKYDHV